MLVLEPESRWPVKTIVKSMADVLFCSGKQGRASDYCAIGIPWPTSIPHDFPPVWKEGEAQHRQEIWNSQLATKSYFSPTYLSGPGLTANINTLTKVIRSKQQLEQFGKSFFDNSGAPGVVNIRLIRRILAVTSSLHALRYNDPTSPQSVMEGETASARSRPGSGTISDGRRATADSQTPIDDESSFRKKRRRTHSVDESETMLTKKRRF